MTKNNNFINNVVQIQILNELWLQYEVQTKLLYNT